jgi:NADH-quinone oxidoreductase subunit H
MGEAIQSLFVLLVVPGFVFTLVLGLVAEYVVRKVSALVQWRVGPPLAQPAYDVAKLLGKEILIPEQAQRATFVAAPLVAVSSVLLLSTMLWLAAWNQTNFVGDVIVAIYLMTLPSLALILGSSASASPHAALGTAREMKLVLSYELPLVLAFIVVLVKTGGTLTLGALGQQAPIGSLSGIIAFVVALLCMQAKLGFVPFDIAEAETELGSGVLMEYSGALLALWKIAHAMMLVALPMFLVVVFLGGFSTPEGTWGIVVGVLKWVGVLVLVILIKNTNPRVRIDQAMKFFWVYCGLAAVAAIVLASLGW